MVESRWPKPRHKALMKAYIGKSVLGTSLAPRLPAFLRNNVNSAVFPAQRLNTYTLNSLYLMAILGAPAMPQIPTHTSSRPILVGLLNHRLLNFEVNISQVYIGITT